MRGPPDAECAARACAGRRQAGRRWADLRKRVASALVLGPLGLLCLWRGDGAWMALLGLAGVGLMVEWAALCRRMASPLGRRAGAGGAVAIVLACGALVWLRADPAVGRVVVLFMVLVVWASDIGAYLAGRLIGGRRLVPRISPAKTWAGALGGLFAAATAGAAVAQATGHGGWGAALVGGLLGVAAQAGDLAESAAKRAAGVKDSGWLIPGHGGLLDRLDGMLAASLLAALLAMLAGRGVVFWR